MARCELTGKGPVVKNLVSHSNIKTKSVAQANIQKKVVFSQALGESLRLQLATSTIRTMEKRGGFDAFLLKQPDASLSKLALKTKRRVERKLNLKKVAQ